MAERMVAPSRTGHGPWVGIVFFSAVSIAFALLCWSAYGIRDQHRELTRVQRSDALPLVETLARVIESSLAPADGIAENSAIDSNLAQLAECLSAPGANDLSGADLQRLLTAVRQRDRTGIARTLEILARARVVSFATLLDADGSVLAAAGPADVGDDRSLTVQRAVLVAPDQVGTLRIGLPPDERFTSQYNGLRRSFALILIVTALTILMTAVVLVRQRALLREAIEERSLTEAVLTGMSDGVIVLDSKGRVRLANPAACRLFAASSTQLVGKDCEETPCAGFVGELAPITTVQEAEVRKIEGSPTPVRAVVAPLRDGRDQLLGRAVILSDRTDACRFEREQRRARSLQAFGRFASMVAHEIRNPLNAISVGVQRLAFEMPPFGREPGSGRLIAMVREEVERLDRILSNFLDLSRPPRLDPSPGDLEAVIDETMPLLQQGTPPGIAITHARNGGTQAVFDRQAVRQVLLNLVHNAVEALGDRGRVEIVTRRDDRSAILEVRDDGPGIPNESLEQLFELGFTTKPAGHGLGLPIVHRLLAEMHGNLEVDSVPGQGTTMRVCLPVTNGFVVT